MSGCGHIDMLAQYPVQGAKYYFKNSVAAGTEILHASTMSTDTTGGVVPMSDRGEKITTEQMQARLDHASPLLLANAASFGIHDILSNYLHAFDVPILKDDSCFVVESELRGFDLRSSSSGTEVRVAVSTKIVDQRSKTVIWDDRQTCVAQMNASAFPPAVGFSGAYATTANAARLLSLSDEDFLKVLEVTTQEASKAVAEAFYVDIDQVKK